MHACQATCMLSSSCAVLSQQLTPPSCYQHCGKLPGPCSAWSTTLSGPCYLKMKETSSHLCQRHGVWYAAVPPQGRCWCMAKLCTVPNAQWLFLVKDVRDNSCGVLQPQHWEDVGVRQSHGAPQCGSRAALCLRPVHRHQLKGVPEELAWALCSPTKGKPKPQTLSSADMTTVQSCTPEGVNI